MKSRGALCSVLLLLLLAWSSRGLAQPIVVVAAPTNGAHFGKAVGMALNLPLQARITNPPAGSPLVQFYANGVVVATGRKQNSYSTIWSNVPFGSYTLLAGLDGAPPLSNPVNIQVDADGVALVSEQSTWKYLDGGMIPPANWFQPDADVAAWPSGLPQFGFGGTDERTTLYSLTPTGTIYPTYYFHHVWAVTNAAGISNLMAQLLRDDGVIVYLNGEELFRDNMPAGPVGYQTYATAGAGPENVFEDRWINPARLLEGTNHLAVEVHNQGAFSDDISFDLRLVANRPVPPPRLTLTRAGTNVVASWPSTYRGYHCEATAQLPNAGTNTWTPVTNVATGTTEFRSTNTAAAAARFFRLAL